MKPESMDKLFHALASAARRRILDILKERPGASVLEISRMNGIPHAAVCSRIAVMKHINVLEGAGLIVSEKRGRIRHLYFNVVPIQQIHERWASEYSALWADALTTFKQHIEKNRDQEQ